MRRNVIILSVAIALLATAGTAAAQAPVRSAPSRIALFRASGFPTIDARAISDGELTRAMRGFDVDVLDSLARLDPDLHRVLVLPYGSAFPAEAWPEIRAFLRRGGSLLVLGGAPFHQPVLGNARDGWRLGTRQVTFAHQLLIGPAEKIEVPSSWRAVPASATWTPLPETPSNVWELTIRLATKPTNTEEEGSEGEREGIVRPLVHLVDAGGIPRACPLIEIDRIRGEGAGGRWIFATSDAPIDSPMIRLLVLRALEGAVDLDAAPVQASVHPGEIPSIRVVLRRPLRAKGEADQRRAELVVADDAGREVHRATMALAAEGDASVGTAELRTRRPLAPGLYHVAVRLADAPWSPREVTTGFWIRDTRLLVDSSPRLTVSRDWLRRDGKVFPVIGTTYMASDVHRQFLFEPDPHVWDRDFAQMAKLGINFMRTGLWTGWTRAAGADGEVGEDVLRALEAYVQTAAKHDIVVCFTFFAFLPPHFGGENPYLDPHSVEAQKRFVESVARQFRGVGWIHYDLINEPSYAPTDGLWSNRPIGDRFEREAWESWVRARHGDDLAALRDAWQDVDDDVLALPRADELSYAMVRNARRPRKAADLAEFSQEMVALWAATLRAAIREAGGDVLVTLGQDEGGTSTRPSPQLHADAVDYTCIHPWWQNDELLSSGVFVKVPEKPSLFQESGLMRLEDVDGRPWRTPAAAARALERKYGYAFASRASGVVEWAWNINPYMPIDNEAVIGFWRVDGTAKKELGVVPQLARFFTTAAPWIDDFAPDAVVVVIPHSRLFLGRPAALDGYRRIVKVLSERFGIVPTALSELRLDAARRASAKLIVVPSLETIDDRAAQALLAAARGGVKVLFTGAITGDRYGRVSAALRELGVADDGRPVELREHAFDGVATFDRNLRESLLRSEAAPLESFTGDVWHEPLPLEHAREDEPLVQLLRRALDAAQVSFSLADDALAMRLLEAPRATLVVLVNESASDAVRVAKIGEKEMTMRVAPGRTRLLLIERATGRVIADTAAEPAR